MARQIEVMGFLLDTKTVRDSILELNKCMNDPALNVAQVVDTAYLSKASENEEMASFLRSCDVTIVQDVMILKENGITAKQRLAEAEDAEFFGAFMRRLTKDKRSVYVLGETRDKVDDLMGHLTESYPEMKICGSFATEEADAEGEQIVNDVNDVLPEVIISILPSPQQEQFLLNHRSKMFTNLFLGTGGVIPFSRKNSGFHKWIRRLTAKRRMAAPKVSELNQWML